MIRPLTGLLCLASCSAFAALAPSTNTLKPSDATLEWARSLPKAIDPSGCSGCSKNVIPESSPSLYVLMSLSVPTQTWVALSNELRMKGGVFVLRGLPNNSFSEMAQKIAILRKAGVDVPVQIDPRLFHEFDVKHVPCIVQRHEGSFDKISGSISVDYALQRFKRGRSEPC